MKTVLPLRAALCLASFLMASSSAEAQWRLPAQLELRVPFEPTAFSGDGRRLLTYELYLTNFSGAAIEIRRIEVLDADKPAARPLGTFGEKQIETMLQLVGGQPAANATVRTLNAGATVVAYMEVALDAAASLPRKVKHRVLTAEDSIEGAVAGTNHTRLKVLVPPVLGKLWHAYDGPSNDPENHHRRGLVALDGKTSISRRYATDWFLTRGRKYDWHVGDPHDTRSYHGYGQEVFAVASGTVVMARDGIPDNMPGPVENFRRAMPLTLETVTGNTVILDIGDGQFAHYYHLQPGSVRVKAGERVRSGTALARIGVSGDPNVPHLHFEITTSARPLAGEGVPFVIDRFRVKAEDDTWKEVARELPVRNMLVDFGSGR